MAILDNELVVLLVVSYLIVKLFQKAPLSHRVMGGLRFWGRVNANEFANFLPEYEKGVETGNGAGDTLRRRRGDGGGKGPEFVQSWSFGKVDVSTMGEEELRSHVGSLVDLTTAYVDPRAENESFQWGNLRQRDAWDQLVTLASTTAVTWVLTSVLSCFLGERGRGASTAAATATCVLCAVLLLWDAMERGLSSAETRLTIVSWVLCLVGALSVVLVPDRVLDFRLGMALADTRARARAVLSDLVDESAADIEPSKGGFLIAMAGVAATLCALVTVPAFRLANLYHSVLRSNRSYVETVLSNLSLYSPVLASLIWVRPILGNMLLPRDLAKCSKDAISRDCPVVPPQQSIWFSESGFTALRAAVTLIAALIQLAMIRTFLAAHLRKARDATVEDVATRAAAAAALPVVRSARKAASKKSSSSSSNKRLTNEDLVTLDRLSASSASYDSFVRHQAAAITLPVAAIHLAAPALIIATLAILLLRLGQLPLDQCLPLHQLASALGIDPLTIFPPLGADPSASSSPSLTQLAAQALKELLGQDPDAAADMTIFSPIFWRPVLSFWLWTLTAWWGIASTLGFLYFEAAAIATSS